MKNLTRKFYTSPLVGGADSRKTEGFQNLKIMELAILITTQGFVHIFEEIINQMDSKSLFEARLTCKDWWKVIENHPKGLRQNIRRIRMQEVIIHPDFHGITNGVEAKKGLKELCFSIKTIF